MKNRSKGDRSEGKLMTVWCVIVGKKGEVSGGEGVLLRRGLVITDKGQVDLREKGSWLGVRRVEGGRGEL